jgi:hypothetical protein
MLLRGVLLDGIWMVKGMSHAPFRWKLSYSGDETLNPIGLRAIVGHQWHKSY